MALLVGFAVVALLLFVVAELVFGPALAVLLTGLCGLGLGGGPGFAAGIVGGLVGLVGSVLLRGLVDGLRPNEGSEGASTPRQHVPPPQWPPNPGPAQPPPHYSPDASALPTPALYGQAPDPASWETRPTPVADRLPVPDERPRYGAEPRLTPCVRLSGPPMRATPESPDRSALPTGAALVRTAAPSRSRGPSTTAPTSVEVHKTKGRAP